MLTVSKNLLGAIKEALITVLAMIVLVIIVLTFINGIDYTIAMFAEIFGLTFHDR